MKRALDLLVFAATWSVLFVTIYAVITLAKWIMPAPPCVM